MVTHITITFFVITKLRNISKADRSYLNPIIYQKELENLDRFVSYKIFVVEEHYLASSTNAAIYMTFVLIKYLRAQF